MATRIPQSFIDDLVARSDIVEIVDERVALKKGGKDYKACCPFHDEKTPSFSVIPDKQFYYCFGCGAHGTAIGFLMDYAHMSFPEAIEELARRAGLEVPVEGRDEGRTESLEPLYEVLETASAFYQRQLRQHPQAQRAVDYLRERGLSGEIAKEFGLGFAPPGWDTLLGALGRADGERELLAEAGLIIEREHRDGHYDRFRDRIVFPIRDRRGRTVGFGARVLGDDTPKYLNSPETPVYHKGRQLYGLYEARQAVRRLDRILVVEGYMDVLALAQYGFRQVVATLGTAATIEHLEQLFRLSRDVVFCFDGDAAGRRAAWRALETTLPLVHEGRQAFFMFLPDGEDPDSLVRGAEPGAFAAQVEGAASLGTFLFDELESQVDMGTIDGRARLVELARPLLAKLRPGSFRDLADRRLAELAGITPGDSSTLSGGTRESAPRRPRSARAPGRRSPSLVRRLITLVLHYPELSAEADDPASFSGAGLPGVPLLVELVEILGESPHLGTGAVIERFRDREDGRHLVKLAAEDVPALSDGLKKEFRDGLTALNRARGESRYKELLGKAQQGGLSEEERREFAALSTAEGVRADDDPVPGA